MPTLDVALLSSSWACSEHAYSMNIAGPLRYHKLHPQAGLDPPGEKWQLGLNIVVALPPKPPRLDIKFYLIGINFLEKTFTPTL